MTTAIDTITADMKKAIPLACSKKKSNDHLATFFKAV